MLLIFILAVILSSISAAKVPICKGISYVGTYYTDHKYREPVYRYSYNLNITKNEKNLTFPNTVTSYNFKEQLNNSSLFQRRSLFNLYFSETDGPMKECNFLIDETCILSGPNAQISMYFEFYYKNRFYSAFEPALFINDGTIFDNKMGKLLGPYRCEMYTMDSDFYLEASVCCPFYEYIDIPDSVEGMRIWPKNTATTLLIIEKSTSKFDTTTSSTTKKSTTKKLISVHSATTHIVPDKRRDNNVQHQSAPCKAWHENIFDFLRDESFWFFKAFFG